MLTCALYTMLFDSLETLDGAEDPECSTKELEHDLALGKAGCTGPDLCILLTIEGTVILLDALV